MDTKPIFSLKTIKSNMPPGIDPWLPPALAAEFAGVDTKWLANAREGRKRIQGPPYIKLGEGRTAPIRYRLSSLIAWMDSFKEQTSTTQRSVVPHANFGRFLANASDCDRWLFVVSPDGRSATNVFEKLTDNKLMSSAKLQWLTRAEYTNRRFIRATLQLDAEALARLKAIGNGDPSVAIQKLLGKPS
jgi:hypothetical protein